MDGEGGDVREGNKVMTRRLFCVADDSKADKINMISRVELRT